MITTFRKFCAAVVLLVLLASAVLFASCSQSSTVLQNGYYTAQTADYDEDGWREYLTIYVSGDKIITVEYDACDANGYARSWDMDFMRSSLEDTGTYPNEYARAYTISLLNWQDPSKLTASLGSMETFDVFIRLSTAAIEHAKTGDKQVAIVD